MKPQSNVAENFDMESDGRRDLQRRDIVDHALSLQQTLNTVSALEYLKAHDIAPAIIARVLLEPQQRRAVTIH